MTKQTVRNMGLMVVEMERQTKFADYKALKALSHSYETLLNSLSDSHEDFQEHKLTEEIKNQLNLIEEINSNLESESIPELLQEGNYFGVNHLTTTTTRLNSVVLCINRLLTQLYKNYNRKVLIVSENLSESEELMYKIIEKNSETIVERSSQNSRRTGALLLTDKNYYTAIMYNEQYRGRRMDYAFLNRNLSNQQKELMLMNLKDKSNVANFG